MHIRKNLNFIGVELQYFFMKLFNKYKLKMPFPVNILGSCIDLGPSRLRNLKNYVSI